MSARVLSRIVAAGHQSAKFGSKSMAKLKTRSETERNKKRASIIIPCWNQVRYTRQCVRSVLRWTRAPFELILVDNGSTDGTAAFLSELRESAGARIIANRRNLGFARAVNQGMASANGKYLVWLNNDAVVTREWLDRLIACAERSPRIAAVGPVVNGDDGRRPMNLNWAAAALALANGGKTFRAAWLTGYCLLLKRAAVRRVGPLDLRFEEGGYEDYDYCLRLRRAGYELAVAQDAFVFHHWHRSFASGAKHRERMAANRRVFRDKWRRVLEAPASVMPPRQPSPPRR